MEDLLFEDFPITPLGAESQLKKAVLLQHSYDYDDSANYLPFAIRNNVPDYLKRDGKLHLAKGIDGFLYNISPNKQLGIVVFLIRCTLIHIAVPLSYLTIGEDFVPLSQKSANMARAAKNPQLSQIDSYPAPDYSAYNGNPMDSFIHAIWYRMRSKLSDFEAHGMESDLFNSFFGSDFQQSVRTITQGFVPDARRVLQNGNFSVTDLLSIPQVTNLWAPTGPTIYIRLYHNEVSGTPQGAIYVGQTIDTRVRHNAHNRDMTQLQSIHYRTARQFIAEHRHMIPICNWDHDISPRVLDMAEQTVILLLKSYWAFPTNLSRPSRIYENHRQSRLMSYFAQHVQNGLVWAPNINLLGLNIESPIFQHKVFRYISSVPMLQSLQSTQTFTRYRTPIGLRPVAKGNPNLRYGYNLVLTNDRGEKVIIYLSLQRADVESMDIPDRGFLVFEIMDNKQPHANPWIRSPAVGPYEDFIQASSLSIRYEWYDKSQGVWLSTTLHKSPAMIRSTVKHNDIERILSVWRMALHIIQALQGIVYLNYRPNEGFHKRLTFGSIHIKHLEIRHLEQTYKWTQRPEISQPFPIKATWQYNFSSMVKRFSSTFTHIPSEPISGTADMNHPIPLLGRGLGMSVNFKTKCDLCVLSPVVDPIQCIQNESSPYGKVCMLCSLFNRPCSFTRRWEMPYLWGFAHPALWPKSPLAKHPDGPLRFLAFHSTRSQGVFQTPEPRERSLGLFSEPKSNEEIDSDPDIDGLDLEEDE